MPDRRSLFGAVAASLLAPRLATAQVTVPQNLCAQFPPGPALENPPPVVDARFPAEIAPGVFVLPDRRVSLVPNVGIVIGREAVLVIDCGIGLESAENVLKTARELARGRRMILTITHPHPEHGFGAKVFKGSATIVYNRAQRDYLVRTGQMFLNFFKAYVLPPNEAAVLDGVTLVEPDRTYDGERATLDLGGRTVEFRAYATAHSPGDQSIYLPQDRVLFAGDLIEERAFPIVPLFPPLTSVSDINVRRWEEILNGFVQLAPRLIVPGHGNLGGPEIATQVRTYFETVRTAAGSGPSASGLSDQIRAKYPFWEHSDWIAPFLAYLAQQGP